MSYIQPPSAPRTPAEAHTTQLPPLEPFGQLAKRPRHQKEHDEETHAQHRPIHDQHDGEDHTHRQIRHIPTRHEPEEDCCDCCEVRKSEEEEWKRVKGHPLACGPAHAAQSTNSM